MTPAKMIGRRGRSTQICAGGLQTLGGVGTAKRLLREDRYSEGFTTLWEKGRLEMSVEFFVLLPWSHRCSMTPSATPPRWDVS